MIILQLALNMKNNTINMRLSSVLILVLVCLIMTSCSNNDFSYEKLEQLVLNPDNNKNPIKEGKVIDFIAKVNKSQYISNVNGIKKEYIEVVIARNVIKTIYIEVNDLVINAKSGDIVQVKARPSGYLVWNINGKEEYALNMVAEKVLKYTPESSIKVNDLEYKSNDGTIIKFDNIVKDVDAFDNLIGTIYLEYSNNNKNILETINKTFIITQAGYNMSLFNYNREGITKEGYQNIELLKDSPKELKGFLNYKLSNINDYILVEAYDDQFKIIYQKKLILE